VRCPQIVGGNAHVAQALRSAVLGIANGWPLLANDKAKQTQFLQMIVDAAWCAGNAYFRASQMTTAEGLTKDYANRVRLANAMLLRQCEEALNRIKGGAEGANMHNYIDRPLSDTKLTDAEQGSAVLGWTDPKTDQKYGVLAWVEQLKADGVVDPKLPEPTSEPESEPAAP
jgi:hypothetical protein